MAWVRLSTRYTGTVTVVLCGPAIVEFFRNGLRRSERRQITWNLTLATDA
jgi:hypothetical protein